MSTVISVMRADPMTVSPEFSLERLESLFLSTGHTGFPVVDEGRLVGVVSRTDIIRSLLTERSRAEQASDFYSAMGPQPPSTELETLDAIAAQVGVRLSRLKVEDVMIRAVVQVDATDSIQSVAKLMRDGHLHRVPVVDGDRLLGLVTSMDFVDAIAEGRFVEAGTTPLLGGVATN